MKYSVVATVAAMAVAVSAQLPDISKAPACAMTCITTTKGCTVGDFKCMCSNTTFQQALHECICKTCEDKAKQDAAGKLAIDVCKSQGADLDPSLATCGKEEPKPEPSKPAESKPAESKPAETEAPSAPGYGSAPAPSAPATEAPVETEAPAKPTDCATPTHPAGNETKPTEVPPPAYTGAANTLVPGVLAFAGFVAALAL